MLSATDMQAHLDQRLRPRRNIALALAGGAGFVEAALLATMVATEPEPLPTDTTIALVAIAVAGLSWAGLALWRLTRREVLLLRDRVAALTMGLVWSSMATLGGAAIASSRSNSTTALVILIGGGTLSVLATELTRRARSDLRRAEDRLRDLTVG